MHFKDHFKVLSVTRELLLSASEKTNRWRGLGGKEA